MSFQLRDIVSTPNSVNGNFLITDFNNDSAGLTDSDGNFWAWWPVKELKLIKRGGNMELVKKKNVTQLKKEVKTHLKTIDSGVKMAIGAAWDCGEVLTELKGKLEHGKFLPYLKQIKLGERNAQKYMKLYKDYERDAALQQATIKEALEATAQKKIEKKKDDDANTNQDSVIYKIDVETAQKLNVMEYIVENFALSLEDNSEFKMKKGSVKKEELIDIIKELKRRFKVV